MYHTKLVFIAVLLSLFSVTAVHAQVALTASGGGGAGSRGSFSYSIGQALYTSLRGSSGIAPLGVQQPYPARLKTGLEKATAGTLKCTAYPNPVSDFLTLKIDDSKASSNSTLTYRLYDLSGKLLEMKRINKSETAISMRGLAASAYHLEISSNKNESMTLTIIKK